MVHYNSGSQWVIGPVICSQQLWLSVGYLSGYMFTTALALSGLVVMLYGS